ncbi:MAG: 2-phosphosulfolactate phosphatase [Mahella sp.]|nr:2-phosphosulfolactate phosphatase [Mahella sp.]
MEKELKGRVAVVIDVLRATSTIVTALANGCKEVIPVMEIEEAVNMAKNYDKNTFLLAGERGTVQENKDIVILCAGTDGKFSLDDVVTAGMVVSYICRNKEDVELDDLALTSRYIYELNKSDLNRLLSHTYHYGKLMEAGFEEDIKYCLKHDVIDIVPHYENGIIRNKANR